MRRSLPNWFIRTLAPGWPLTFSKRRAGPPAFGRAAMEFGGAVGDFGHLEDGVYFGGDAFELAGFLECFDPVAQVGVGQLLLLWAGIPPTPAKVCKVFESETLGLDFGVCFVAVILV